MNKSPYVTMASPPKNSADWQYRPFSSLNKNTIRLIIGNNWMNLMFVTQDDKVVKTKCQENNIVLNCR
jgi:hypothetical protein